MLLLTGDSKYADNLERALYNGALAGLSLDGSTYFYVNPLEDDGTHRRREWFGCACCPPNIARLLAQLPGYFYATSDHAIWINLYAQNDVTLNFGNEQRVKLQIETRYPYDGEIEIAVSEIAHQSTFALHLRAPAWCDNPQLQINGERASYELQNGYAVIARDWKNGDKVLWSLPMRAKCVQAHPRVAENRGSVAIRRGPLVYCIESCDHDFDISTVAISVDSSFQERSCDDLPDGLIALQTEAELKPAFFNWSDELYRTAQNENGHKVLLTAIPYFAWANREAGAMRVWIPTL